MSNIKKEALNNYIVQLTDSSDNSKVVLNLQNVFFVDGAAAPFVWYDSYGNAWSVLESLDEAAPWLPSFKCRGVYSAAGTGTAVAKNVPFSRVISAVSNVSVSPYNTTIGFGDPTNPTFLLWVVEGLDSFLAAAQD